MANTTSLDIKHRELYRTHSDWYYSSTRCYSAIVQNSHRIGVTADFGKYRGMRRVWCISIVAASFIVSQLVGLSAQDVEHLQYAVTLVGISYGGVYGLLPTITIEWFGMGAHNHLFPLGPQRLTHPSGSIFMRPLDRYTQPTSRKTGVSFPYLQS